MRPPGSVTYPVQAPRQLHDAKRVPGRSGHSTIKEQHPGSSAHPPGTRSLQSISSAKQHFSSLEFFKTSHSPHCSLSSPLWERAGRVAVAVLGFISPPLLYLLCMSRWNPTPSVLGRNTARPVPRKERIATGGS